MRIKSLGRGQLKKTTHHHNDICEYITIFIDKIGNAAGRYRYLFTETNRLFVVLIIVVSFCNNHLFAFKYSSSSGKVWVICARQNGKK